MFQAASETSLSFYQLSISFPAAVSISLLSSIHSVEANKELITILILEYKEFNQLLCLDKKYRRNKNRMDGVKVYLCCWRQKISPSNKNLLVEF